MSDSLILGAFLIARWMPRYHAAYIIDELAAVDLGANTFDEAALQVIARAVQGNLRLCRNLAQASLITACLDHQRIVTVAHVNTALLQPHWRSHEALIKQQVKPEPKRTWKAAVNRTPNNSEISDPNLRFQPMRRV